MKWDLNMICRNINIYLNRGNIHKISVLYEIQKIKNYLFSST